MVQLNRCWRFGFRTITDVHAVKWNIAGCDGSQKMVHWKRSKKKCEVEKNVFSMILDILK